MDAIRLILGGSHVVMNIPTGGGKSFPQIAANVFSEGDVTSSYHVIPCIYLCTCDICHSLRFGTKLSRFEGSYQPSEIWWNGGTETCHWSVTLSYICWHIISQHTIHLMAHFLAGILWGGTPIVAILNPRWHNCWQNFLSQNGSRSDVDISST